MPTYPKNSKCSHLGCKNPRSKLNSFCSEHGGKESLVRDYDAAYNTPAWRQIRQGQLSKHPLCQACLIEGRVTLALHVDHVFPWRQIGEQAFRRNIFNSLCQGHHSHKTALERKGIFECYRDKVEQFTDADYARVVAERAG
jgi:5-methylcytosine-specific restriction protein A